MSRAEEYCEGYTYGVYRGRADSAAGTDAGGPSYQAGFARGVSAANRARDGESSVVESSKEAVSDLVQRLENDYRRQGQIFTEEQSKEWSSLQASIKRNGEKSYQDILLELYRHLKGLYYEDVLLRGTKEEAAAIGIVRDGVVSRLAKTSLVLPVQG